MHLTKDQIREIIDMGHDIGVHTYSHISVATSNLGKDDIEKEIIHPKKNIEKMYNTKVRAFSYPFGEKKDCLDTASFLKKIKEYEFAFTVEEKLNTRLTSKYDFGRYMPHSSDDEVKLKNKLNYIAKKEL